MSVAQFFAGTFGPSTDVSSPDAWSRLFGFGAAPTAAGVHVSERNSFEQPGVQSCLRLLSDTLAMIPAVVERWERSSKSWISIDDHPCEFMLNTQPNEYMTPLVARKMLETTRSGWGNGLTEIVRNGRGQAQEFWPLEAGTVWPYRDDTSGQPRIRYRGTVAGRPFNKEAGEIVHLKGMTLNGLVGLSPIAEAREAVALGFALQKFGNSFFGNEGRSGGFVEGFKGDTITLANLREYLNSQSGLEHAHRYKILPEGTKYASSTIPPEDAQFLLTREFQLADTCRLFGVPLELVYAQGATSKWGSGIEALLIAFIRWTIQPIALQTSQEFSIKFLTREELVQGVRVRLMVDELLDGDSAALSAFIERMVRARVMNRNEGRQKIGLNPVAGGDIFDDPKALGAPSGSGGESPDPLEQELDRERKENGDQ